MVNSKKRRDNTENVPHLSFSCTSESLKKIKSWIRTGKKRKIIPDSKPKIDVVISTKKLITAKYTYFANEKFLLECR